MNKIILLAILLFPFQILALPLAGSRYDLTCFLFLIVAMYYAVNTGSISFRTFLILSFFGVYQFLIFSIQQIAPFSRFISGLVWLGGLLLIILVSPKIIIQKLQVSQIILVLLLFTAIIIIVQHFILNQERPKAFFDEASYAGLVLYSASASTFLVLTFIQTSTKTKILGLLLGALLFYSALLTKSLHIVTFLTTIILFVFLRLSKLPKEHKSTIIISGLILISILVFFASSLIRDPHYAARMDLTNIENNLSLLTWIRGYDQMIASVIKSSFFGLGLGSTCYFKFDSIYNSALTSLGFGDLNLTDAYSLAFRLIIEIGLLLFVIFIIFMVKKIWTFKRYISRFTELSINESAPSIFLFVFSFSLILGCLIKEPTYARSYIYLGIFLFSVPILDNSDSKNTIDLNTVLRFIRSNFRT